MPICHPEAGWLWDHDTWSQVDTGAARDVCAEVHLEAGRLRDHATQFARRLATGRATGNVGLEPQSANEVDESSFDGRVVVTVMKQCLVAKCHASATPICTRLRALGCCDERLPRCLGSQSASQVTRRGQDQTRGHSPVTFASRKMSWIAGVSPRTRWAVNMIHTVDTTSQADVRNGQEEARRWTSSSGRRQEMQIGAGAGKYPLAKLPTGSGQERQLQPARNQVLVDNERSHESGFVNPMTGLGDATYAARVLLTSPSLPAAVAAPGDSFLDSFSQTFCCSKLLARNSDKSRQRPRGRRDLPLQPEREEPPKGSFMDARRVRCHQKKRGGGPREACYANETIALHKQTRYRRVGHAWRRSWNRNLVTETTVVGVSAALKEAGVRVDAVSPGSDERNWTQVQMLAK